MQPLQLYGSNVARDAIYVHETVSHISVESNILLCAPYIMRSIMRMDVLQVISFERRVLLMKVKLASLATDKHNDENSS